MKELSPRAATAVLQYVPAFRRQYRESRPPPTPDRSDVLIDRIGGCGAHDPDLRHPRRSPFARRRSERNRTHRRLADAGQVGQRRGSSLARNCHAHSRDSIEPSPIHRGLDGRPPAVGRSGFTIVEVLVSLVILSIGLLGIAKLVLYSAHSNDSAYLRSQATQLAYEILDNMRANPTAAAAGNYNTRARRGRLQPRLQLPERGVPVAPQSGALRRLCVEVAPRGRLRRAEHCLPGKARSPSRRPPPIMATIVVQWDDAAAQSIFGGTAVGVAAPMSVTLETALHP